MSFSKKIKSFLGKKQDTLFYTAARIFLDSRPALNALDVLPFMVEAGCLLYGKAPTMADYSLMFEELTMKLSENERTSFIIGLRGIITGKAKADVTAVKSLEKEDRIALLEAVLSVMPDNVRPVENTQTLMSSLADRIGLDDACANEIFAQYCEERQHQSVMFASGAGLSVVLAVIFILILLAIYLKAVFFGFLAAYLALPLEDFFETRFLKSRPVKCVKRIFFCILGRPIQNLKKFFSRKWGVGTTEIISSKERRRRMLQKKTVNASGLTLVTLLIFLVSVIVVAFVFIFPFIMEKGEELRNYAFTAEHKTTAAAPSASGSEVSASVPEGKTTPEKPEIVPARNSTPQGGSFQDVVMSVLKELRKEMMHIDWVRETLSNKDFIMANGKSVLTLLFKGVSSAGHFLFDIIVFFASFFLFLQKMAFYRVRYGEKSGNPLKSTQEKAQEISSWTIKTIFNSDWLPEIDPKTRESATSIFARVIMMFDSWITGYFKIIIIEFCLYVPVFLLFGVPYALPLACISCMTVLLPVVGITSCVITTTMVTMLCVPHDGNMVFALVGVALAYLCINAILEQLILYPSLVGETLGLTALEAIFVVLLGAVVAGIAGMILAVPVAALLKFLVPICYSVLRQHRKKKDNAAEA